MTNIKHTQPSQKASHTPGPWRVAQFFDSIRVLAPSARVIADMGYTTSQAAADARLIAAAPELLAALQELVHHPYDSEGRNLAALDRARAAIAKAGG